MANNNNSAPTAAELTVIANKNKQTIENSVTHRLDAMRKSGGIALPKGYNAGNELTLALLELSEMKDQTTGQPILAVVEPTSVAQSLFRMCVLGVSLSRKQCAFIKYGNRLNFQLEYHGRLALAKRFGGAGEPRAQVIYADDEFEYMIDTRTGNKVVTTHIQKLGNIDNTKIIGAWALVPYADDPDRQPYIEVMSMDEIRTAWKQGATKGGSPAHVNFTQEMVKKTVLGRACKLFITASNDSGMYEYYTDNNNDLTKDAPDEQGPDKIIAVDLDAIPVEKVEKAIADAPVIEAADTDTGEVKETHEPDPIPAAAPEQESGKGGLFNGLD